MLPSSHVITSPLIVPAPAGQSGPRWSGTSRALWLDLRWSEEADEAHVIREPIKLAEQPSRGVPMYVMVQPDWVITLPDQYGALS